MELTGNEIRGKEIVATKGKVIAIYRLMGRELYIRGVPNEQYHQMLANFKQRHVLKSHEHKNGWIKLVFIEDIDLTSLYEEFFSSMVNALKMMGFVCVVKEI